MIEKRFNSPLHSNMVIDMEHKIPSIICRDSKQVEEFLTGLNALHEENKKLKDENEQLKQSHKEAWDLIKFIYDEIKEDGSMDYDRIRDLVVFE